MKKLEWKGLSILKNLAQVKLTLETVEGLQFGRGYKSPYFVTNNSNMTATLDNPLILIADQKITQVKELLPILEAVWSTSKITFNYC